MRHEYMDVPPPTDTHRPYLERELYEKAVSRILDQARLLDGVKGESSMDYETLIESLRNACQEDGSPYFIVPLSKYDRRRLKS